MPRVAAAVALTVGICLLTGGCTKPVSKDVAIDHFVKGKILLDAGDVETALAELGQAVKVDPDLSIAYATMGDIHRRRGQWELARGAYESACQTNPFAFKAHYNLGVTYQALAAATEVAEKVKEYLEKAVEVYLRAITLSPDDFDSHLNISACYFQLGQADEAEKYCRLAIKIDPNNPAAYANLGTIKESQDDLYEAIRAYKASLEQDPNQPDLLIRLGSAYMKQGRLKSALLTFHEAARQAPTDSVPWEKTGACYFYLRDFAKAQDGLRPGPGAEPLQRRRSSRHGRGLHGAVHPGPQPDRPPRQGPGGVERLSGHPVRPGRPQTPGPEIHAHSHRVAVFCLRVPIVKLTVRRPGTAADRSFSRAQRISFHITPATTYIKTQPLGM